RLRRRRERGRDRRARWRASGREGAEAADRGRDPRRGRKTPPVVEAVVMAAGEGRRLRPLTERYAKPVLPVDGRPVLATLLRELAGAGCERVWLVTGHLAEQVECVAGDGSA